MNSRLEKPVDGSFKWLPLPHWASLPATINPIQTSLPNAALTTRWYMSCLKSFTIILSHPNSCLRKSVLSACLSDEETGFKRLGDLGRAQRQHVKESLSTFLWIQHPTLHLCALPPFTESKLVFLCHLKDSLSSFSQYISPVYLPSPHPQLLKRMINEQYAPLYSEVLCHLF